MLLIISLFVHSAISNKDRYYFFFLTIPNLLLNSSIKYLQSGSQFCTQHQHGPMTTICFRVCSLDHMCFRGRGMKEK